MFLLENVLIGLTQTVIYNVYCVPVVSTVSSVSGCIDVGIHEIPYIAFHKGVLFDV